MPHVIIITDRQGNEISVPGQHSAVAEEDHDTITVTIDIEKIIDLYNIEQKKQKKDE